MLNFKIKREEFLSALQRIGSVVRDNRVVPAASGVHIEIMDDQMELRGTDLEVTLIDKVSIIGKGSGSFVVKPLQIIEYLRELYEEVIELRCEGNLVILNAGSSSSSFSCYEVADYPDIFNFEADVSRKVDVSAMVEGLEKTIMGASTRAENRAMNCIRIEVDEIIRMVTCDTYRLFYYEKDLGSSGPEIKFSLPLKAAGVMLKILKSEKISECIISVSKNQVCFLLDNTKILSKLIDLPFPDYKAILSNQGTSINVAASSAELIGVLKRVHIFARENMDTRNSALLNFSNEGYLEVSAFNENAKVKEKIDVKLKGKSIIISLNVKFMLDFLTQISEDCIIKMKNKDSAVQLGQKDNEKFLCIIMPLAYR